MLCGALPHRFVALQPFHAPEPIFAFTFCSTEVIRELKHATFLSHGRRPESAELRRKLVTNNDALCILGPFYGPLRQLSCVYCSHHGEV